MSELLVGIKHALATLQMFHTGLRQGTCGGVLAMAGDTPKISQMTLQKK